MNSEPSASARDTGRDPLPVLAAVTAAGCVGETAPMVVPLYLGAVAADFGVSEGTAGIVPSLEIAGVACGSVLFATLGRRIHPRFAVWVAMVLIAVGQIVSMTIDSWAIFVGIRAIVGFGEGVLVASASIQASLTLKAHRTFSVLLFSIIGVFMAMSLVLPLVIERAGPRGAFGVMLVLAVVVAPILVGFPTRRGRDAGERDSSWLTSRGIRLLIAAVFLYIAFGALWTYAGQIGLSVGLSLAGVGLVITLSGAVGALGPLGAGLVGLRWGHAAPIAISMVLVAATGMLLAHSWSPSVFSFATVVILAAFMFFVTYLRGLMGALDSSGRLVGVGVGVVVFGGSLGSLAGGFVLNAGGGYGGLGGLAVVCCAVSCVLGAPVAWSEDRSRARTSSYRLARAADDG